VLNALARARLPLFAGILTIVQMVILVPLMSRLSTEKPLPAVYARADIEAGKAVYQARCSACHGSDARGEPAMMSQMGGLDISAVAGRSPDRVVHVVRHGKGAMPPFYEITDEELSKMLIYLRRLELEE